MRPTPNNGYTQRQPTHQESAHSDAHSLNVGKHSKKHSEDYEIYLRHMENTTGTNRERWKKVKNVVIDPMVIIPIAIGLGFLVWTYFTQDTIFKSLLSFISAFGLGIGINHFTFLFKDQAEYQTLKFKFHNLYIAYFLITIIRNNIKRKR